MSFKQGDKLFSPGEEPKYVYFPVNAMISIAKDTINGNSIDIAIVGEEGAVGLRGLFFNNNPYRVYVASSGLAYVIEMNKIKSLSTKSWNKSLLRPLACTSTIFISG
jgi:CRP-like cAMP-binding protein